MIYSPLKKGNSAACGSQVAQSCAKINGVEHIMYITMTATVCFTVFIFALDINGTFFSGVAFPEATLGLVVNSPTALCHISRQMEVYVTIKTMRGIIKTDTLYL